jgi:hypothetical protein
MSHSRYKYFRSVSIPLGKTEQRQESLSNPYIEEQTTYWSKENKQTDKPRSTKHTHKTKDREARTSLKTGR